MSLLSRCTGPECPHCGCTQSEILQEPRGDRPRLIEEGGRKRWAEGSRWFGSTGRAKCGHCRRVFSFTEVPEPPVNVPLEPEVNEAMPPELSMADVPVQFQEPVVGRPDVVMVQQRTITTPKCPECGETMKVSSTRKALRWFKCAKCGKTLKIAR